LEEAEEIARLHAAQHDYDLVREETADAIADAIAALAVEPASGETTPDDDLSSGNRNKYTGRFRAPPPPPTQGEEP
jgi:hypothetical protein